MTKQLCYKLLLFFFFSVFFMFSGYSQSVPLPSGQECEGTQIKTDDGLVFVKKGERRRVKIGGKWYICVGCEGCVEVETNDLPSSQASQASSRGRGGRRQGEMVDEYDLWAQKHGFANFQDYFNKAQKVRQQYSLESLIAQGKNQQIFEAQARDLYTRLKKLSSQMETSEAMTELVSAADWGIRAVRASDLETARKWAGYFFDTEAAASKMSNYSFSNQEDLSQALQELKELVPVSLQIQEKLTAANEKRTILEQKSLDIKVKKETLKDEISKSKDEDKKKELKQEIIKLENEESDLLKEALQVNQEASEMIKKAEDYVDKVDKIEKLLSSQGKK